MPFLFFLLLVAFLAMAGFLGLNGVRFAPTQESAPAAILSIAAGEVGEEGPARWISDNLTGRARPPQLRPRGLLL